MEGKSLFFSNLNKDCVDPCLLSIHQKVSQRKLPLVWGGGGPGILSLEERASSEVPV